MLIEVVPDEFVIRSAVGDAIGAVLGSIHGLPHGMNVQDATEMAVRKIVANGFYQPDRG